MNTLITGGTGLIGRTLVPVLIASGHRVTVLTRNPETVDFPPETRVVEWDGKTTTGWSTIVKNMDAIVHLAGENIGSGRWSPARKQQILNSRIDSGKALVTAIQQASRRPKIFLQASAIGIYGASDDHILNEDTKPGNGYLPDLAVQWESSTQGAESLGSRRVIIRTGVVLSSESLALQRLLVPYRFFIGGPVGSGRQWISWIHIRDQVKAIQFLIENDQAYGIYNLTSPQPVTFDNFGKTIANTIHRPHWMPVPSLVLKILLGEMSTVVLDSQRVVPGRLLLAGFKFQFEELSFALKDILECKNY